MSTQDTPQAGGDRETELAIVRRAYAKHVLGTPRSRTRASRRRSRLSTANISSGRGHGRCCAGRIVMYRRRATIRWQAKT
jgi:hypothetical protein